MECTKLAKRESFDKDEVKHILDYVGTKSQKYLILIKFMLRGMKLQDILKLRVIDVKDKDELFIEEIKTKKIIQIRNLKEIQEYIENKNGYEYLFPSIKDERTPIKRAVVIKTLKKYSRDIRIDEQFCITPERLHATFIYAMWESSRDITFISKLLATSDLNIINSYIGIIKL